MQILDLKAHRCPTAKILARRAIRGFNQNGVTGDTLAIQTIEPSFVRDLELFLNAENLNIKIQDTLKGDISRESIAQWLSDEECFDPEDWVDCVQHCFILELS